MYDHYVIIEHNDGLTTMPELSSIDEEQLATLATPRTTPKRKSLFHNIERKSIKKSKIDTFSFI